MTRVIFMGTPDFAVPALGAMLDHPAYKVVGVVTQPDRPAGRGRALRPSPIKVVAENAGIPVFQPKTLRTTEAVEQLAAWAPDLIVVAAFGQILKQNVLDLPRFGCVNVHASLLPRWRGAAPIHAAIRAGDSESGVTIMLMDAGLDTGPMLAQSTVEITAEDTGQSLHNKLAAVGGTLLIDTLAGYLAGTIQPEPQPESETLVTYAGQISKQDGAIDWTMTAVEIDRLVRAFTPWPGTFTMWNGTLLKVKSGTVAEGNATPGDVITHHDDLAIGTGQGLYVPVELQLAGKKSVLASDFLRGHADFIGSQLA